MTSEEWKDIPGYEGLYQVSTQGRVRSLDRVVVYSDGRTYKYPGKELAANICMKYDVHMVHLYKNCKRVGKTIHRLVAEAFIPNPDGKSDVNHIDGDRNNNTVENLEWTTRLENMQHGFRTGLINNTGTNHGNNIYTEAQVLKVKEMLVLKRPQSEIEAATGVKRGTIQQIRQGKQWKHL